MMATSASMMTNPRYGSQGPPGVYQYLYAIPTANVAGVVTDMVKNNALGESVGSRRVHWGYIPAGYKPIVLLYSQFVKR
jgi:hypothetical protein